MSSVDSLDWYEDLYEEDNPIEDELDAHFTQWCEERGLDPEDDEAISAFFDN